MKGLIICGYPGVGKSSIAGWNNCIDLESSCFSKRDDAGTKNDWINDYCILAINLANQGFTVFTSTHSEVIQRLVLYKGFGSVRIVIFAPKPEMRDEWAERLLKRCLNDEPQNSQDNNKNYRALSRICMWHSDMKELMEYNLPIYSPKSIDYDLRDYVKLIRQKEGLDDEVTSETDASVAEMAGVAKTESD